MKVLEKDRVVARKGAHRRPPIGGGPAPGGAPEDRVARSHRVAPRAPPPRAARRRAQPLRRLRCHPGCYLRGEHHAWLRDPGASPPVGAPRRGAGVVRPRRGAGGAGLDRVDHKSRRLARLGRCARLRADSRRPNPRADGFEGERPCRAPLGVRDRWPCPRRLAIEIRAVLRWPPFSVWDSPPPPSRKRSSRRSSVPIRWASRA